MLNRREWQSLFVVDESRLTRLHQVLTERFNHLGIESEFLFRATFKNGKVSDRTSIAELIAEDNTKRNPITSLVITAKTNGQSPSEVRVGYYDRTAKNVEIQVEGDQPVSVNDVYAVAEEQVERCFESNWPPIIAALGCLFFTLMTVFGFLASQPTGRIENKSLKQLAGLGASAVTPDAKTDFIFQYELADLNARLAGSVITMDMGWFAGRNAIVLILLITAIGLCVAIILQYPRSVFVWGDAGRNHENRVARRAHLWSFLIGAIILGCVAGAAVAVLMDHQP